MECLTATVSFDLFMDNYLTSFRLFVCLPTLELKTFEQEVCQTRGYANTLSSGAKSKKKKSDDFEQRSARQAKTLCYLCGWLERQQDALHNFF